MDDRVLDRLTLVTLFYDRGVVRSVSAYADVQARVPGLSYERPMATVEDLSGAVAVVCIKPFTAATEDEAVALA